MSNSTTPEAKSFGPTHVFEPTQKHTCTIVFLHGRGSSGVEFAEELCDLLPESPNAQPSLAQKLPNWRWVFPSSRELWSTTFQEYMPAWFEAPSLTDTEAGQELQAPGIQDAVTHVQNILDAEIERLGGRSEKVFIAGISQGGAIAMWTQLCFPRQSIGSEAPKTGSTHAGSLGGLVVASTWLPFSTELERFYAGADGHQYGENEAQHKKKAAGWGGASRFVHEMLTHTMPKSQSQSPSVKAMKTPVFFGHGVDDAYVDIDLGRQAADVFRKAGFKVDWKEYQGAEQEGHWFQAPDEIGDILDFLHKYA